MIRLKANELPQDKNLTIQVPFDPHPLHNCTDIVWMSLDEWFAKEKSWKDIKDPAFKKQLEEKITEWTEAALSHKNDTFYWPVKFASVKFYLPEGKFAITPGCLGAEIDSCMFEKISQDIEDSLREMGALYVFYTGMLD